jgi:hypothetical protein
MDLGEMKDETKFYKEVNNLYMWASIKRGIKLACMTRRGTYQSRGKGTQCLPLQPLRSRHRNGAVRQRHATTYLQPKTEATDRNT